MLGQKAKPKRKAVKRRMRPRNGWRAGYIERCTSGSQGGSRKPAGAIQQGGGFLPYKSSVTENLSDALRRKRKRVLVLDGDRQRNASTTLLHGQASPTLAEVITGATTLQEAMREAKPGLYILPGSGDLNDPATSIVMHRAAYYTIKHQLEQINGLDYVIIDHAGAYTPVMEALLLASDALLIPCLLEPYAVAGLFDMFGREESTILANDHL
jgi:chromosome partitioning protein